MTRPKGSGWGSGAECPECGSVDTPARIGGFDVDGQRIRLRVCECGFRFVTVEVPVLQEEGRSIPYSWVDEMYRLRQRESARKRYRRKGGGPFRGLRTKKPIEGVARLLVKVQVKFEKGMRVETRHGTAEPPKFTPRTGLAPQHLVPVDERKEIVRRYEAGVPVASLAREYRISPRSIQRYARHYGKKAA